MAQQLTEYGRKEEVAVKEKNELKMTLTFLARVTKIQNNTKQKNDGWH